LAAEQKKKNEKIQKRIRLKEEQVVPHYITPPLPAIAAQFICCSGLTLVVMILHS
jgi:hypothetical protein